MVLQVSQDSLSLEFQLASKDDQIRHLQAEISRISLENTFKTDSSLGEDRAIAKGFKDLQKDIHNLVKVWYQIDGIPPRIEGYTGAPAEFFQSWHDKLGKKNLINRIRGIIFIVFYEEMMKKPYFGMTGSHPTLETVLSMFEDQVLNNASEGVKRYPKVAAWRTSTLILARRLQLEYLFDKEVEGETKEYPCVVLHIWGLIKLFLNPSRDTAHRKERKAQICREISELHTKTSNFMLSLRAHSDIFEVVMPGAILNDLEYVRPSGSERSDLSMMTPSPIAFTMSGALIKYSGISGERIGVLTKANVILGDRRR